MFGSKKLFILNLCFFLALPLKAEWDDPPKRIYSKKLNRPAISRSFLGTSLVHWQHAVVIDDGETQIPFNGSSVSAGLGLGHVFSAKPFSIVVQGQLLLGTSDVALAPDGALPGNLGDLTFLANGIGFMGLKADFSLLLLAKEGVAVGLGLPLISTFYFKRNLADGEATLKPQDFIQWGFFLDFRLRRKGNVFNPKLGFIRNSRQYFASIDYQWHF